MLDPRLTEIYHTRDNLRVINTCLRDEGFCKQAGLVKEGQVLENLWQKAMNIFRPAGQEQGDQSPWGGILRSILAGYQTRFGQLSPRVPSWLDASKMSTQSLTAPVEAAAQLQGITGIPIPPELQQVMAQNAASGQV